jgi:hypothetical protein
MGVRKRYPFSADHITKIGTLVDAAIDALIASKDVKPDERRKQLAEWYDLRGVITDISDGGEGDDGGDSGDEDAEVKAQLEKDERAAKAATRKAEKEARAAASSNA